MLSPPANARCSDRRPVHPESAAHPIAASKAGSVIHPLSPASTNTPNARHPESAVWVMSMVPLDAASQAASGTLAIDAGAPARAAKASVVAYSRVSPTMDSSRTCRTRTIGGVVAALITAPPAARRE